ncbi:putative membrane protein [Acinetobacter baumannii 1437282]|nr:putative membrane protein [Acinetobacter baumannii 1437282]
MTNQNTTVIKTDPVNHHLADLTIISLKRFIFLSIISLGLYELWWIFKAWRFFAIKDHLNIMPAARAIFSIFFLYSLFKKIREYAKAQGDVQEFSAGWMYIGYILFALVFANLPDPYWLISSVSFMFLIPAFVALNHAKKQDDQLNAVIQEKFSIAQIFVIIIGSIFWILLLIGFFLEV